MSKPTSPGRRRVARIFSWTLAVGCACVASGCLSPRVIALAKGTKRERYEATITAVTRAAQRDSGALLVCVETLTSLDTRDQVHLEVPLQKLAALRDRTSLRFASDAGFDSSAASDTAALRYVFFASQLRPGCPDAEPSIPVQASAASDGASGAVLYAMPAQKGVSLRYHSPEALWSSVRDVDLAPVLLGDVEKPGRGNPAYWLVLPFAALFDVLLALPFFLS